MEKISNSPEQTQLFGIDFSNKISKGDIIAINGELGAGKTTFIKGVLKGLGYRGNVKSPTYTLINEYDSKYKTIHIDCYREKNINRWLDVGIMDYLNGDDIVIIEWAEYINSILPDDIINIDIYHLSESDRKIEFSLWKLYL